jgi:drug/metabolite transporter (DMT)-like permease
MASLTVRLEQRKISYKKYSIIGILDSMTGLMQIFAVNNLDGTLVVLLSQAAIPFSMVFSFYLLNFRYTWLHVTGAFFVIAGLVITIAPQMVTGLVNHHHF